MVVLTALDLEYQAVRAHLAAVRRLSHPSGTLFEAGSLPGGWGRVVLAAVGVGNLAAAVLAERAIAMFQPRALLFVGVAGAIDDDIELGDVVVATKVYPYHGGKEDEAGFFPRPRAWEIPHELDQVARYIARTGSWLALLSSDSPQAPPAVHFKPIAAGEVVLNSRDAPLARQLRQTYGDAAAIEMESAGVSHAGHLNRSLPVLTIRGISDRADGAKQVADGQGWQPIAATNAAAFALAVIADICASTALRPDISPAFVDRPWGASLQRTVRHLIGVVPEAADAYQPRDVTDRIDAALNADGTAILTGMAAQILSGLGGVGKTQLAAAVARRLRDRGDLYLLVWVSAVSVDAILTGYARAGAEVTGIDPSDPRTAATALLEWLSTTTNSWLVVLDDLADPRDLDGWWPPRTSTGQVVVTTRRRDGALATHGTLVEVGMFTPTEAHSYLTGKFANDPDQLVEADELAADLGYLPLALSQAAAYMTDKAITCAGYRSRFANRHRHLLDLAPDILPDDYSRPVAVTLSLSIEVADNLPPKGLANPLMAVLAMLDPNGIPAALVTSQAVRTYLTQHSDTRPALPLIDEDTAGDALASLVRLHLADLSGNGSGRQVRIHALAQRAARDQTSVEIAVAAMTAAADGLLEIWPEIERDTGVGPTLRANTQILRRQGEDHLWQPNCHALLLRAGRSLGQAGLVSAAIDHFQRLSQEAESRLGADSPSALYIRGTLATWRGEAGDAAGAATALGVLLERQIRVLGRDHPDTLHTRGSLATWRGHSGHAAEAVVAFEALLADQSRVRGPDDPVTLSTRSNLASWRGRAGQAAEAAAAFEEVLTDRLRILGPTHPHTLTTRSNLASWRGRAGQAAEAAAAFEELLDDRLRLLGPDHPETLTTRGNVAGWRGRAGDPAGAAAAYEALLADRLRVLGPEHPQTLTTRHNLARWRGEAGDPAGAAEAYEALLTDRLRLLGPDHPHTQTTRHNLAYMRAEAGDPAGAAEAYEALLTDRLRLLGPDHPDTLTTRHNLTRMRAEAGGHTGVAVAAFWELLGDMLRILGPDHPDTVATQSALSYWQAESSRRSA